MKDDKRLKNGFASFQQQFNNNREEMEALVEDGQKPNYLILACSDSRVDPAVLFKLRPGEAFVIRNVANMLPPYECDHMHHGTSAALEFGICYLHIPRLIIMGHSHCGGIAAYCDSSSLQQDDFLSDWLAPLAPLHKMSDTSDCAKQSLLLSYQRAMTYPWMASRVKAEALAIDVCFFDLEKGELLFYDFVAHQFISL